MCLSLLIQFINIGYHVFLHPELFFIWGLLSPRHSTALGKISGNLRMCLNCLRNCRFIQLLAMATSAEFAGLKSITQSPWKEIPRVRGTTWTVKYISPSCNYVLIVLDSNGTDLHCAYRQNKKDWFSWGRDNLVGPMYGVQILTCYCQG